MRSPTQARVTVFLAASEAAADAGVRRLRALLPQRLSRTVRRVREPLRGLALQWLGRFGREAVWVTTTNPAGWAALADQRPDLFRTVHLRPGPMPVRDALDHLWTRAPAAAERWAALVARDRALGAGPTLAEEDLFGGGSAPAARLAALLGDPRLEIAAAGSDRAGYEQALAAALGADPGEPTPPPGWAPGGVFPVRTGGSGLALLGTGWSYDEPDRVWSDGETPVLRLPSVPPGRDLIVRLIGEVARPEPGPLRVRVLHGGGVLGELVRRAGDPPEFRLEVRLTGGSETGRPELALAVQGAVRPGDLHAGGDGRLLGVALKQIELQDGGRPPAGTVELLWEELVRRRGLRTALAVGADPAALAHAVERLRALSLLVRTLQLADGAEADALTRAATEAQLVVLCDAAAAAAWFATPSVGLSAAMRGAWHLVLAGGDPRLWPEGLEAYAQERSALIHVTDFSTVVEAGATA